MTNVIELAKQAGAVVEAGLAPVFSSHAELHLFATLVRNAALEQCLEIADQCADADMHASMAANAIRNIKEPTP